MYFTSRIYAGILIHTRLNLYSILKFSVHSKYTVDITSSILNASFPFSSSFGRQAMGTHDI
jgi:hypothetical protein